MGFIYAPSRKTCFIYLYKYFIYILFIYFIFHHITPILKSLYWLNMNERIQYKVLSLTYKTLNSSRPAYLHSLVNLNHSRSTRSSSLVTLNRPSNPPHLQITNRSFYHTAPAMCNCLPSEFRQLVPFSSTSPLAISPTLFHKKQKNQLFDSPFPPQSLPGLDYTWTFIPGIDLGLFHLCHFLFFWLCTVSENKYSLICFIFTGTINQLQFMLLFILHPFHFAVSSSRFKWSTLDCNRAYAHSGFQILH